MMHYSTEAFRNLHTSLAHAQYEGFSDIQYEQRDFEAIRNAKTADEKYKALHSGVPATRRPTEYDIGVFAMFNQTWGSTALGHGGMGGAAITDAYTIVLECEATHEFLVYFGGQYCYTVPRSSKNIMVFVEDVKNRCLESKRKSEKYLDNLNDS